VHPPEQPLTDFFISASFEGDVAVLALAGEVDIVTSPEFSAFFDTLLARGHYSVVLDLAGLYFMDASGLAVIADGAARLERVGGTLVIRTPTPMIEEVLRITGFTRLVRVEVGPEVGPKEWVRSGLRQFSALRSEDEVLDGALRMAVSLASALVGGADGASVSLRRHGRLSTVAASDRTIASMDASQYETGEGPCIDASVEGRWFHAEILGSETRWPAFTPQARALGINAILSSPLLVEDRPVGALNIYSLSASAFSPEDRELAATFAAEASAILADAATSEGDEARGQLTIRFQGALRAREVIAQAQGVLMEREGLAEEEAYSALRRFSQGNGTPLQERALDIVTSTRRARPGGADV
jgi:anti-anti-sigma factor